MKRKAINSVLRKKFNLFVESITDDRVKELVKNGTIITGGCIVSMLLKKDVNDFDLYFKDRETALAVTWYYVRKFQKNNPSTEIKVDEEDNRVKIIVTSQGVAVDKDEDTNILERPFEEVIPVLSPPKDDSAYKPVFLSSNAITLSNKIQLIIRFFGSPEEIHKNYDFIHCTNYWTSWDNAVVLQPNALESIITEELIYQGSKYPVCSVIRTRKFIKRGWHINAGQYLKMLFQVSELDLTNIAVLEDQLVGVDSAYFDLLIKALKEQKEKNNDFVVTSSYIAAIVDKIF